MAIYKKIVDVETVAEATENMNVLVEDAGTLKKVSMENIGGENGNFLIIRYKESAAPMSLENDATNTYYSNMTFAEFEEILMAGELSGMSFNKLNQNDGQFEFYLGSYIDLSYYPEYFKLIFYAASNDTYINLLFYSNNTIEQEEIDV